MPRRKYEYRIRIEKRIDGKLKTVESFDCELGIFYGQMIIRYKGVEKISTIGRVIKGFGAIFRKILKV